MKFSELFQDKYTVIFVLIVVLLVSVWISRTYRNGGFGAWISPSEGYGTGVIEGLVVSTPQWIGDEYTYGTNPPITPAPTAAQATAAADSKLILDRCSRVSNTKTIFRFIFKHFTASASGADRKLTITIPQSHIESPNLTDLAITLKPSAAVTTATVTAASLSGTNIETATGGPNITVTTTAPNFIIEFKLQSTTAITANTMYALELSGLKWKNGLSATLTPTPAADTLVTLESSMEPAGSQRLAAINLHSATAAKIVKIFQDTTYDLDPAYADCRKITTAPLAQLVELSSNDESNTASTVGAETTFKLEFMLTNPYKTGDLLMIQLPNVTKLGSNISIRIKQGARSASDGVSTFTTVPGSHSYATFVMSSSSPILANTSSILIINGLRTPDASKLSSTGIKIQTFLASTISAGVGFDSPNFLDKGLYTFPEILARPTTAVSTGAPTSSGTASDGTTYVTSAAANVLISDVKRQMNWAVEAQKEYESVYKELRSATTPQAKTDAQLKYDVAVARRNRLIASHPDSWYDGANWRYGDDGHVRKCAEPSNLSSNEGNCQNIFRMDISGNIVKSAEGNNILLMRKCPWKCNNPGQTGSDSCRIDADCLKVTRWATYLPDGTQIEKNLLASTRSQYDDIARDTSSSTLGEDDIYKRGITRDFKGYGQRPGQGQGQGQTPGLFGSIRDATGSIIRGIGNWIDPNDPAGNKRTAKHNAYYYEDGSPAATAYLGMYNGQGYEEESPFYGASKPMNYYYTTNYYYTDGQASGSAGGAAGGADGEAAGGSKPSKVMPYEQSINL